MSKKHKPTPPPPPPSPTPSPENTTVPPASQIIDAAGAVWTLSGMTILRNGAQAAGGFGYEILWYNSQIYVVGDDAQWWQWSGSGWGFYGASSPNGSPTPSPTTPPAPLTITCPPNQTLVSPDGQPVVATYPQPTTTGGTPPVTTSETPPSGSRFPVGTTPVSASAHSADGQTMNCSFSISVNAPPPPPGPVYYVSTTGSDSRTKAQAADPSTPWLTPQHAADVASPGDTMRLFDGVYRTAGVNDAVINLTRGGLSLGQLVTFEAINKWGAKLDGQNNAVSFGVRPVNAAQWIQFRNLEMFGMGGAAGFFNDDTGGANYRLIGCHIHDIGRYCEPNTPPDEGGKVGVFSSRPGLYLDGNVWHTIGRFAAGEGGCGNAFPSNHDHAVYLSRLGNQQVTAINNIFYDLTRGWAMQFQLGDATDVLIANNAFDNYNPDRDGQILFFDQGTCTNIRILNNVSTNAHTGFVYFYDGAYSATTLQNNTVESGSLSQIIGPGKTGTITESGLLVVNAPYLNPPADYHTPSGSPLRNSGVVVAEVTHDFDGIARPQGAAYDRGVYEAA